MRHLPRLLALVLFALASPLSALAQALPTPTPAPTPGRSAPASPDEPADPVRLDDPMTFSILTGRGPFGEARWIQGAGLITPETPEAFAAFLREGGHEGLVLALSSQGGDLAAGLALGRAIREAGLATTVGFHAFPVEGGEAQFHGGRTLCHGACALAFLGGARRTLHEHAGLGFHFRGLALPDGGPRLTASLARADRARLARYLAAMGIDAGLMRQIAALGANDDVSLTSHEDVVRFRVAEMPAFPEPQARGWRISRRPDTPGLHRTMPFIARAERPVRAEIVISCGEGSDFEWMIDLILPGASSADDARLRALTLTIGRERLTRPNTEDDGWTMREDLNFTWDGQTAREALLAAARARAFTLALAGPSGWTGRAELADGLAEPLRRLTADCDAYNARPVAPGR